MWAAPFTAIDTVGGIANRHLGEALRQTFFMGAAAFVHGPLFYPVVLLWRLSPVVWLSLVGLGFLFIVRKRIKSVESYNRPVIILLVAWGILYLGMITLATNKFDRYILPVVPSLLLLAAIAWVELSRARPHAGRWLLAGVVGTRAFFCLFTRAILWRLITR